MDNQWVAIVSGLPSPPKDLHNEQRHKPFVSTTTQRYLHMQKERERGKNTKTHMDNY